jgi:predicted ATP-grasp superfamily ATP-dependent carboligase
MIRTVLVHEYVTGGGLASEELPASWASEGRAMRRTLAEDFARLDGVRIVMTLDARLPDEPGDWTTVRVGPGQEPDLFARLAAECDYTLCVAPETGGILERRAITIERARGRSLGSSPGAIALCADKLRLAEHLLRIGIDTPPSRRVCPARDGLPRDHPYPAVLKPIDGAGSVDTYEIASPDDVPCSALAMPGAMLQPFVPGRVMSAAFLIVPQADPLLLGLADQTIERAGGRFAYLGGVVPSRIDFDDAPLIAAARSVPGLLGWVGIDFVWDAEAETMTVLEINPRVTTSYVGLREVESAGLDSPRWIADLWWNRVLHPGPGTVNPWRKRVSGGRPVTFSADGRIEREAIFG